MDVVAIDVLRVVFAIVVRFFYDPVNRREAGRVPCSVYKATRPFLSRAGFAEHWPVMVEAGGPAGKRLVLDEANIFLVCSSPVLITRSRVILACRNLYNYSNNISCKFDKFRVDSHLCTRRDTPAARFLAVRCHDSIIVDVCACFLRSPCL